MEKRMYETPSMVVVYLGTRHSVMQAVSDDLPNQPAGAPRHRGRRTQPWDEE